MHNQVFGPRREQARLTRPHVRERPRCTRRSPAARSHHKDRRHHAVRHEGRRLDPYCTKVACSVCVSTKVAGSKFVCTKVAGSTFVGTKVAGTTSDGTIGRVLDMYPRAWPTSGKPRGASTRIVKRPATPPTWQCSAVQCGPPRPQHGKYGPPRPQHGKYSAVIRSATPPTWHVQCRRAPGCGGGAVYN